MSRSPTSFGQFSTPLTPITPEAQPVNTFVQPAVRKAGNGSWLDLARSLSSVEPKLGALFQEQAQGYQNSEQIRAEADFAKNKNIDDFNAAVKSGQISETQNPWYVRRTRQLQGIDLANQARANAFNAWQQNAAVKNSDDPAVAQQFFQQQLGGVTQGMDTYSAAAAQPVIAQSMNWLMQTHEAYREQQRPVEQQDAFNRNVADIMTSIDDKTMKAYYAGDDAATQTVNSATQNLQQLTQSQIRYTDPVTVKNWTKQALTNVATDRLSGDVFRQFYLNGLTKTDGSPLDNSDDAKAHARTLDQEIQERQLRQRAMAVQKNNLDDDTARRQGKIGIVNLLNEQRKTNPNATLANLDPSQVLKSVPQSVALDVMNSLATSASAQQGITNTRSEQERQQLFNSKLSDYMAGKLGTDGDRAFITTLGMLNGAGEAREIEAARNSLMREGPLVSKVDSVVEMYKRWNDGQLDFPWLSQQLQGGNLTKADFYHGNELAARNPEGPFGDGGRSTMVNLNSRLEDQMAAGFLARAKQSGTLPGEEQVPKGQQLSYVKMGDTFHQAYNEAQRQFGDIVAKKMRDPDFVRLSPDQRSKELTPYLDDISDSLGGFTGDEHKEWLQNQITTTETPKPTPQPPITPPAKMPDAGTPQASVVKAMLSGSFPQHMQGISMDDTSKAQQIANNKPAEVDQQTWDKLAPPSNPSQKVATFAYQNKHGSNPDDDPVMAAAAARQDLRSDYAKRNSAGSNAAMSTDANDDNAKSNADLTNAILASRQKAQMREASFTPTMTKEYSELVKQAGTTGQLGPGSALRLRQLERERTIVAQAREAGGWSADELSEMVKANPQAWRDHPVYANPAAFTNTPENVKQIESDMQKIGLDPKNSAQAQDYIVAQRMLTEYLRTRQ